MGKVWNLHGECVEVFVRNLKEREDLEHLSIEGRITKKMWTVFIGSSGGIL
jgi:hypothetical protein